MENSTENADNNLLSNLDKFGFTFHLLEDYLENNKNMIKMNFYEPNVMDLPAASTEPLIKQSNKSAISLAQEFCQKRNYRLPEYNDHSRTAAGKWVCSVKHNVPEKWNFVFKGEGNSKSEAKNIAASLLYDAMSNNNQQSTSANSNHNGSSLVEEMEFESSNFIIPATDTDLNSAYITKLFELCKKRFKTNPVYNSKVDGNEFIAEYTLNEFVGTGQSTCNKKIAKQKAAMALLNTLNKL